MNDFFTSHPHKTQGRADNPVLRLKSPTLPLHSCPPYAEIGEETKFHFPANPIYSVEGQRSPRTAKRQAQADAAL